MSRFASLQGPPLHDAVLEVRRNHARNEYDLIQALLAVEAADLHRQMGCGTVVHYASKYLNLDPQKASELLRVGRVLPKYPQLAESIAEGRLHWSKIREITRVISPENEERLVAYAESHQSREVQRLTARRPRAAAEVAPATDPPVQPDLFAASSEAPPPGDSQDVPVKPSRILYEMRLSPMQYARQEQVLNRIRSRLGFHASRERVQEEMCRIVLSVGEVRTQTRYQVYLHVDGLTGEGWLDTERGLLPAPKQVVQEALGSGRVKEITRIGGPVGRSRAWGRALHTVPVAGAGPCEGSEAAVEADAEAVVQGVGEASGKNSRRPHSKGRRKIPMRTMRQLLEESEGRCVECGRRTRVQFNHRDEPYSECGEHDPAKMDARCDACHEIFHLEDFRARPGWQKARDRAVGGRRQRKSGRGELGRGSRGAGGEDES